MNPSWPREIFMLTGYQAEPLLPFSIRIKTLRGGLNVILKGHRSPVLHLDKEPTHQERFRMTSYDLVCQTWSQMSPLRRPQRKIFSKRLEASMFLFTWIWFFKHKSHLYWFIYTKWLLWALCNSHGRTLCVFPLKLACFYDCLSIKTFLYTLF